MAINTKFRTAVLIAAMALGISLLIVGRNAKAQTAPTPAAATSAPATSAGTGTGQTSLDSPLTMPKLSSIYINIDNKYVIERNSQLRELAREKDSSKLLFSPELIRKDRDASLLALAQTNLKNGISNGELAALTKAATGIMNVCSMGTDYIQYRLARNSNTEFWYGVTAGLFGVGGATSTIISSVKGMNAAALLSLNRSKTITSEGDTGHSNADLKHVLDQVRQELSTGVNNYNKAMLMLSSSKDEQLSQYRHLQAAVFEMHSACAFF